LALLAILGLGLSARIRDWTKRLTRFHWLQAGLYGAIFIVLLAVIQFPFTLFRSYLREKQFDLLKQPLDAWLIDQVKGLGIAVVLISVFATVLYAVLRRTPRTWWLWGWAVVMIFAIIGTAIGPVFITPLFNKMTPLPQSELRDRILALAKSQGVPAQDVYEMDASRQTDRIGAYVAGALGTTRIVMFDTLMKRGNTDQILMITGHEMGHYVLNHIWKTIALMAVATFVGFALLGLLFRRISARWQAAGITGISDPAGFPLLMLLFVCFMFILSPLMVTWSRMIEAEADHFGLQATGLADAAATSFLMLGEYRELAPRPVVEFLFFDHPSGRNRIHSAMEWKKEHREQVQRPSGNGVVSGH
jgi:STE24 endopeptidase